MADRWEQNIFGMIPKDEWLDVGTEVTRPNDPIDGLFGDEKTDNLVARWQTIANEYQIPMMARYHAFDTEAQTTVRVPIDTHNIEKGLIKVKINQSERLRELIGAGVQQDALYDYVINDGLRLAGEVETRTKVAKNELMATGQVTIKENGLDLTVDYGVPAANTAYTIDLSTTADVPAQLQAVIDDALAKGTTITGIMTAKKNLTRMRQNELMQTFIYGNVGAGTLVRNADFVDFLDTEFGISTIVVNDLTYNAESKLDPNTGRPVVAPKRYYPDDKITFFAANPAGKLGTGLWGDPPEVSAQRFIDGAASSLNNYIYVSQWAENDPAVTWTKASALFMPVLYNPNSLFIGSVTLGE